MAKNIKKEVKKHKNISYTNKDFYSLRQDLQRYANAHFSDNIVDFSDASLGGLLLDIAAYTGDVMTYYLDHQFNENSIENAIEPYNVERLIRESGTEIPPASPAYVELTLYIVVSAVLSNNGYTPNTLELPIIQKNSIFSTQSGINFYLLDDIDFSDVDSSGKLIATSVVGKVSNNTPVNFVLSRKGIAISSEIVSETVSIEDKLVPFRTITLSKSNINDIISVIDSDGDQYYEVESLSQDTVFKYYENSRYDKKDVPFRMEMQHAPKRYIKSRSYNTGLTTIRFGSGDEENFDEDIIPDPSDYALKMYGDKDNIPIISIDPNSFLTTQTLGISPRNTNLTITYRFGGGISHNVNAGEISVIKTLLTKFSSGTPLTSEISVRNSVDVINLFKASGGEDEPTLDELRNIAIFNRNSQNRIVTREDLIARIYSMPARFGRIFRVSVNDNPRNPRGAQIFILSRDSKGKLTVSSDTLKKNIVTYLNSYRIVSDAVDILDGIIVNIGFNYTVTVEKGYQEEVVINSINSKLIKYLDIKNFQINKPIVIGDLTNLILNTPGVVSLITLKPVPKSGYVNGNSYSNYSFNVNDLLDRGFLFPPSGGVFELRYPNEDIVGSVL